MKMRRVLVVVGFVLMCGIGMSAQQPKPHSWPQEPNSFLGIAFGQPLRASVRECPSEVQYGHKVYREYKADYPCFNQYGSSYIVYNVRTFYKIYPVEVNGNVEDVEASFKAWSTQDVAQALTEKFGTAEVDKVIPVQNRMGASFEDHTLTWKGTNVEIDFDSIGSNVDEGSVAAYTNAYVAFKNRDKNEHKDAVKGIL
jgi:hypothetical protein